MAVNFQNNHSLAQQVDSVEVYIFTTSVAVYRYTSNERDQVIGGYTYQAVPIHRSGFTRDINLRVATCQIQAPITTFFQQYIASTPIIPVTVEIRKYFVTDLAHCQYVFNGVIIGATIKNHVAEVECASKGYELKERVPHVFFQSYCNNVLYGTMCGANVNDNTYTTTIIAISSDGTRLEFDHTYIDNVGMFRLATMNFNGDKRMVTAHDEEYILTIHFPFSDLTVGSTITISMGCDKSPTTCINRFNNFDNFVGFPYIPAGKNPTIRPIR